MTYKVELKCKLSFLTKDIQTLPFYLRTPAPPLLKLNPCFSPCFVPLKPEP